ncbi:PTS mannitol transporter subunit IICB [Pectinatus frisingensis]|uniref:PTS mannitol transporter subunit IICB n=1 Tax=Pectinatus frisingensis TaxID=865 RepID=UPI001E37096F|nr:PTS mannitol transporter subunit IICBA [Pectinatus frisingensis]
MENMALTLQKSSVAKIKIQRFGRFLAGMVIPNISAFIAFGLITSLFISTGWYPNEKLAELVGPLVKTLLPLLIGYTGGKIVYGERGAVVGALATLGLVVGAQIPMFMGAMVMGPLGGYLIKKFDDMVGDKVKSGFEMIVNNFSAGILGGILMIFSFLVIGPIVQSINIVISGIMQQFIKANLLPLSAILIEPAKVLFLNNAIDHGILGPLGIQQTVTQGKSILFLLVTNPGPGLGLLLAYWVYGKGTTKDSIPGAIIIHFLGGIHEIYFPYVLMNPLTIVGVIAGGISGTLTFTFLHTGLVATPSPGSIFALMAMTPKGNFISILSGVVIATIVSFIVSSIFVKMAKDHGNLQEAVNTKNSLKNSGNILDQIIPIETITEKVDKIIVKKIVVACDAGMGSSAMAAAVLAKKIKTAGLDIAVEHAPIQNIPDDADIVVTHIELTDSAKKAKPNKKHVSISDYISAPEYDTLITELKSNKN